MEENARFSLLPFVHLMSDALASLVWLTQHKCVLSVWQDPNLFFLDLQMMNKARKQKEKQIVPSIICPNFYSSMVFDIGSKLFMSDGYHNHIDLFDIDKNILLDNYFKIDEPLADTLICRLMMPNLNNLIGITKDSSFFITDMRAKGIVRNEKLPFRILSHNYNQNYQRIVLGVKYKGKYSHAELEIEDFLKEEKISEIIKKNIENRIIEDDNFSPQEHIHSVALSNSCKYKALGTKGKIYLYQEDPIGLECVYQTHSLREMDKPGLPEICFKVNQVSFFPKRESILVSGGGDGYIRFYDIEKRINSEQSICFSKKIKDELNSFLDVGWNQEGTWLYYTKGYDGKLGDLNNDSRKDLIKNKIYFQSMEGVCKNECLQKLFNL